MKKTLLILLFLYAGANLPTANSQPTWSVDVAPIFYANCTKCHNPTGIAPFSLITYSDSYTNASAIQNAVVSKIMPPWPPDPTFRHLAYERVLTPAQITTISDWVNAGAPVGDTTLAPIPPVYNGLAEITSPDLVAQIQTYTVTSTTDIYRCFVIPSNLATQMYITEIEGLPGNRSIVHHVLVYEDTTNVPATLDAGDPGPGYTNFGGTGSNASNLIGAWVPGSSVYKLPAGMGILLHAHTNIVIQVHYPAGSFNQTDSTRINFKLSSGPLRAVTISPILNYYYTITNGPISIPANTLRTYNEQYTTIGDYSLLSVGPHMHLIGRSISAWGVTPSSTTIPFISIPSWNFHWQGSYSFPTVQKIPSGTTLRATATYDNTTNNPFNPNNPPKLVVAGEKTTDEMMLVYLAYVPYQPGDENIIIDSAAVLNAINATDGHGPALLEPYPNPSNSEVNIQFYLKENENVQLSIYDLSGRESAIISSGKMYNTGVNTISYDLATLPGGIYFLRLQTKDGVAIKKLLKM